MQPRSTRRAFSAAGLTAFGATLVPGRTRAAQFDLKMGMNLAATHPTAARLTQMCAAIEQESGGRVHITPFYAGALGSDTSMLSQLRVGALHFEILSPGILATVVPPADIGNIGYVFRNPDEAIHAIDGPLGAYLQQEISARGMWALRTIFDNGMYQVGAVATPIRTPADFRGFKLRVSDSKITVDLFKTLGANPTPMNPNDMYSALQTKLIDGEAAPLQVIETNHLYEVNKFISLTDHAWGGQYVIANGEMWKGLGPELQGLIERNNTKYAGLGRADMRSGDAAVVTKMRARGIPVNEARPEAFRQMLRPYFESWAATFGPTEWGLLEKSIGRKLT